MPKVKLEALREGMVVTADVKNLDDMLLIPSGCALTEKHIEILRSWGVAELQVDAAGKADNSTDPWLRLPPDVADKLAQELRAIFRGFDPNNPVQQELYHLLLRRKARQYLGR